MTRSSCSGALSLAVCLGALASPAAAQMPADPLVFLDFEEGAGARTADRTGHGFDGVLTDGPVWEAGAVRVSGDARVLVGPDRALRGDAFSYDLWFEADGDTGNGDGRLVAQTERVGGLGPEVFERSRNRFGVRINNHDCTFQAPAVGDRSNDGGSDHYAIPTETFHREDGPEHFILVHEPGGRRVQVYQGMEGGPLQLTFDGTYSGGYDVSDEPLALGNMPEAGRSFHARFFQFAYYARALTSDEANASHAAGPRASLNVGPPPPPPAGCGPYPATEGAASRMLDVHLGDATRLSFHFEGLPDPGGLAQASLAMHLTDADHPGEEGQVFVNGQGPLDLPANAAWTDVASDATLAIPPAMLVPGRNTIEFGAGSRDRTVYEVGGLVLSVDGPVCHPQVDAATPPPPPPVDAATPPPPDAATPPPPPDSDATPPEPALDAWIVDSDGGTPPGLERDGGRDTPVPIFGDRDAADGDGSTAESPTGHGTCGIGYSSAMEGAGWLLAGVAYGLIRRRR